MKNCFWQSRRRAGAVTAVLLLLVICIAPAVAIGVSGVIYKGSIAPGGTDTFTMTVRNGANENPTDILLTVMGFGQAMDRGYLTLDPAADLSPYSARTYISLNKNSFHLEPGTSEDVTATITLPKDVGAGGRYAIIFIYALPGKGQAMTTAVNVPILITITGTTPAEKGNIVKIETGEITIGQPIVVMTTFQNTGDYHYYHAVNTVTITDAGGRIISKDSTVPSIHAIIPRSTVGYRITPKVTDLPLGSYTIKSEVLLEDGRILDAKSTPLEIQKPYVPPVTESSITLTPGSPGTLTSPDGRYSITFPQGAVIGDVVVTLKPYPKESLRPAPEGAKLGAICFEITGLSGLLSKDATVRVKYSADDLTAAGGDASLLKLSYWDAAQNKWMILPTQVDAQGMTLTATTNHLSVWSVMVSSPTSTAAPAGMLPFKIPLPIEVCLIAVLIAMVIIRFTARHNK